MKLAGVELVHVDLPFRQAIGTADGVHRVRPLLFVRVVTEEAEGWGECAALADGTAVDPALQAVEQAAVERGVPRLYEATAARGGQLPTAAGVAQIFGSTPVDRMLAATFEMAVADAELRADGRSLAEDLGVREGFEDLAVGAVVGIPDGHDVAALRQAVDAAVQAGVARVRLKIEPGWVVEPVRAVRNDHPDVVLQVDANGSFGTDAEDVAVLSRLDDYDVLCIEQPLPPADLVAHSRLAQLLPIPICLDESLSTPRRVSDALRNRSCAMACLKPARLGGVRATRARTPPAPPPACLPSSAASSRPAWGGPRIWPWQPRLGQDATGLVSDVGDPADYLAVDPCGYPPVRSGWVRVPDAPGVGNPPEGPVLEKLEALRRWFPATYT